MMSLSFILIECLDVRRVSICLFILVLQLSVYESPVAKHADLHTELKYKIRVDNIHWTTNKYLMFEMKTSATNNRPGKVSSCYSSFVLSRITKHKVQDFDSFTK